MVFSYLLGCKWIITTSKLRISIIKIMKKLQDLSNKDIIMQKQCWKKKWKWE